jgi:hypothetical protein
MFITHYPIVNIDTVKGPLSVNLIWGACTGLESCPCLLRS